MTRILLLGGTTEARLLAERLAACPDIHTLLSLAGRTVAPMRQAVATRVGGFGGVEGLTRFLRSERIDGLVNATHPYAAQMSRHATAAAAATECQLIVLRRPPWTAVAGDRWTAVDDAAHAVRQLGSAPRRVFVALGRGDLAPLETAPQHRYVLRSVDPIEPPLGMPHQTAIVARGPFSKDTERALLHHHRIDAIVCKNSGGGATYGKIAAARDLGIEVLMIRRPAEPPGPTCDSVEAALAAILAHAKTSGIARGV